MTNNTEHFKKKLEEELAVVTADLESVGRINPENKKDWQATPSDIDVIPADRDEVADSIESFEENTAILKQLEIRANEIKKALENIENGTYGKCSVCGQDIEEKRLEANPASHTCVKHTK